MNETITKINELKKNVAGVFVGRDETIQKLALGFFSGLHVLIEDIPGVGKTTLAKALAVSAGCDFGRIQFTPDLLPGDILGMTVFSVEKREFIFKPGAVMHQFVLADEINRASPRTQSSLLQAMQEGSITIDDRTFELPTPFFVIGTQNPSDFTGTFPLPEAQLDRFGISFSIGYPLKKEESLILSRFKESNPLEHIDPVITPGDVNEIRKQIRTVHYNEAMDNYMLEIIQQTRANPKIKLGASPRASQHLLLTSQTQAFFSGRDYIIPDDVILAAELVLPHRILLSSEAKIGGLSARKIISEILHQVPRPSGIE
ncbi:MAG: MoxR family ATPase [Spirochaetales bacterium]|nr:MoxR family ATPase [Spirochaetales bacterium]